MAVLTLLLLAALSFNNASRGSAYCSSVATSLGSAECLPEPARSIATGSNPESCSNARLLYQHQAPIPAPCTSTMSFVSNESTPTAIRCTAPFWKQNWKQTFNSELAYPWAAGIHVRFFRQLQAPARSKRGGETERQRDRDQRILLPLCHWCHGEALEVWEQHRCLDEVERWSCAWTRSLSHYHNLASLHRLTLMSGFESLWRELEEKDLNSNETLVATSCVGASSSALSADGATPWPALAALWSARPPELLFFACHNWFCPTTPHPKCRYPASSLPPLDPLQFPCTQLTADSP